jgi:hypothetical protein
MWDAACRVCQLGHVVAVFSIAGCVEVFGVLVLAIETFCNSLQTVLGMQRQRKRQEEHKQK